MTVGGGDKQEGYWPGAIVPHVSGGGAIRSYRYRIDTAAANAMVESKMAFSPLIGTSERFIDGRLGQMTFGAQPGLSDGGFAAASIIEDPLAGLFGTNDTLTIIHRIRLNEELPPVFINDDDQVTLFAAWCGSNPLLDASWAGLVSDPSDTLFGGSEGLCGAMGENNFFGREFEPWGGDEMYVRFTIVKDGPSDVVVESAVSHSGVSWQLNSFGPKVLPASPLFTGVQLVSMDQNAVFGAHAVGRWGWEYCDIYLGTPPTNQPITYRSAQQGIRRNLAP